MRGRAAISWLATAAAIAALCHGCAARKRDGPPVEGTGAGTVVLRMGGATTVMTWVYANVEAPGYKVAAANAVLDKVAAWNTLLDGVQQIIFEADALPPKRMDVSMSWGPGRAVAATAVDPAWLKPRRMDRERFVGTLIVPKGKLRSAEVQLEFDVDLKKAGWAG